MTLSLMHETRAMSRGLAEPVDKAEELRRLVLRLQDGDRTAFEHLVATTQNSAYRLGYSVAQDHHLCQDAVQDAYVSVQKRPQSLTEVTEKEGPSTDGLEEKATRRIQLSKALLRLTDTDRTILSLREVQGFSYEEISEILDIPMGTVKSMVSNARRRLIQAYDV